MARHITQNHALQMILATDTPLVWEDDVTSIHEFATHGDKLQLRVIWNMPTSNSIYSIEVLDRAEWQS